MLNLNLQKLEEVAQAAFDAAEAKGGKDARRWTVAIVKAKLQLETNPYIHDEGDALLILSPVSNEIYHSNGSCQCQAWNRAGRGGCRQNPIRADHLRRATGLSVFGLLDYRGWPRRRLHSPRTERMTEKIAVTPIAMRVQTKKNSPKSPLRLAMPPTSPDPLMWMTGRPDARSDKTRMMTYPDRRPASTTVPYSQTSRNNTGMRFENPPGAIPRTTSSTW